MKRAIGYKRVSSQEQAMEGVSLKAQDKKIQTYCELHDFELIGIEADQGISGKSIKYRAGILRVLDMVSMNAVDAVIILKIDRLARNTMEALEIAKYLDKKGISLHSINEKIDTKSATGEFFFTLLASLAQMERKLIGERTKNSLRYLQSQSRRYNAYPLYGYEHIDGNLVPVEDEQVVIKVVMKLAGAGHRISGICRRLTELDYKPRSSEQWHYSVVKKIVTDASKRNKINEGISLEPEFSG